MRALLVVLALFSVSGWSQADDADILYPWGTGTEKSTGDDGVVASFTGTFDFFGVQYNKIYVNTNGPISFGIPMNDFSQDPEPEVEPYIAAFWEDIRLSYNLGSIWTRTSTDAGDLAQAAIDVGHLGYTGDIDYLIVVTFDSVQLYNAVDEDPTNLFQVVLVFCQDGALFSIFNYGRIDWGSVAVAAYNEGQKKQIVNLPVSEQMGRAVNYSNICQRGRVVTRIDLSNIVVNVVPCVCTSTIAGGVVGYGLGTDQLPSGDKQLFTRTQGLITDPCKFNVKAVMDANANILWVSINVGVHSNPTKHKRAFQLNRWGQGQIFERGQGACKCVISLPHTWTDGATTIEILEDPVTGWTVTGVGCGYSFRYNPGGTEPVLEAVISDSTAAIVDGACGALP